MHVKNNNNPKATHLIENTALSILFIFLQKYGMNCFLDCFYNICFMKIYALFFYVLVSSSTYGQEKTKDWEFAQNQPAFGELYETTINQGYLRGRVVRAWLPEGYFSAKKSFETVYFHDGQMLFDSTQTWNHQFWDLPNAAQRYLSQHQCVFIGIDSHPKNRYAEFFPAPIYPNLPLAVQLSLRDSLWYGLPLFDAYANALINDVFPLVENSWNVKRGGDHRTMVGASMGAIVAFTLLLEHPTELAKVACLSIHLPLIDVWQYRDRFRDPIATAFNQFVVENSFRVEHKAIYIDRGNQSLDRGYATYFPQFEAALKKFSNRNQVTVKLIRNSGHSEKDWSRRIGRILAKLMK